MLRIRLDGDEKKKANDIFQTLHMGFLMGAPPEGLRGLTRNRLAIKVLDRFEAVARREDSYRAGEFRNVTSSGDALYDLDPKYTYMDMEISEVEMLKEHMENCPWLPKASRFVVAAFSALEDASDPSEARQA